MNFVKFLIFLSLVFIGVLLFYAFKYRNPYRFRMYIGKKGSGKTTMIVKLALKYQKKGMRVYSTVPVPGCYFIEPYRLGVDYIPPNRLVWFGIIAILRSSAKQTGITSSCSVIISISCMLFLRHLI